MMHGKTAVLLLSLFLIPAQARPGFCGHPDRTSAPSSSSGTAHSSDAAQAGEGGTPHELLLDQKDLEAEGAVPRRTNSELEAGEKKQEKQDEEYMRRREQQLNAVDQENKTVNREAQKRQKESVDKVDKEADRLWTQREKERARAIASLNRSFHKKPRKKPLLYSPDPNRTVQP